MLSIVALCIGFLLDFFIGDPYWLPHPIRWIGSLISVLLRLVRRYCVTDRSRLIGGALMWGATLLVTWAVALGFIRLCYAVGNSVGGVIGESVLCFYCLSARSLKSESMKVYDRLKSGDIQGARAAVAMIVGRDTSVLDGEGVTKAAVETVAENTSDGIAAPLLYMLLFGGIGGIVYKAANTLDSMVGYVDKDYLYIGRVSAKADDVLNYIPSRLCAVIMIAAAYILGLDGDNAYKIWRRDSRKHASPNSAQTEAVAAGALGVRLAGNATYFGVVHNKPYIGDKCREIECEDIVRANRLMYLTAVLYLALGAIIKAVIIWLW
jgi:adenosylcobinamide-phosphate synthase